MNTWLTIIGIGVLALIIGMILYRKTIPDYKKVNKSNFIGGILIPLLFAFFFGQTLIDIFPGLTFID